jgi:hypothetical protein
MSGHRTWRERLGLPAEHHPEPVFEPSDDPVLVAFAQLFVESELVPSTQTSGSDRCVLALVRCLKRNWYARRASPRAVRRDLTPVWGDTAPVTGFRTGMTRLPGHDAHGCDATGRAQVALLLLVTSRSSTCPRGEGTTPIVQGAIDAGDDRFRSPCSSPTQCQPVSTPSEISPRHRPQRRRGHSSSGGE